MRPSLSPPGSRCGEGLPSSSESSAGSCPTLSFAGTDKLRGAPCLSRHGSPLQARWKGVKTLKWSPPAGVTAPGGTTVTPGWARNSIRSSAQARASRSSRPRA